MEKEKPRLARLTAILTQLQSKGLVTASEIAQRHGVSVRTIYRDIRTLELSGVPIVTEEGKGYHLMEGYKLPPVMFTEQEANALVTAAKIVGNNKDASLVETYGQAIEKIMAVLKQSDKAKSELLDNRMFVMGNRYEERTSDKLIEIQSAITNSFVLKLDYKSAEETRTQREVEPFALVNTRDNWLAIAYCRLRKAYRAFRLDRIEVLQRTGATFEPSTMTLKEYYQKTYGN